MKPNNISNTTTDILISPVTTEDFANFMNMDYDPSDDAFLNTFLLTACSICISHTNMELLERTYTYRADRYPEISRPYSGLGTIPATLQPWVELPIYPVQSITSVKIDDVLITDYTADLFSIPCRIELGIYGKIEIEYVAGKTLSEDIDNRLIMGIKLLAQYLFDNRGCDTTKAIEMSGASALWYTVKILIGGL